MLCPLHGSAILKMDADSKLSGLLSCQMVP